MVAAKVRLGGMELSGSNLGPENGGENTGRMEGVHDTGVWVMHLLLDAFFIFCPVENV